MLATLQEVKNYLDITDSDSDTVLTQLLAAADAYIKTYTNRNLESDTFTEYKNGKGELELLLNEYPVTTLTSFQYNSGTLSTPVWSDFDEDSYKLDPEPWKIWQVSPLVKWLQNIKLIYTAWFITAPKDLSQAAVQLTAFYFNWKESDGIKSENVDWVSLSYADKKTVPTTILTTLNLYKNVQTF